MAGQDQQRTTRRDDDPDEGAPPPAAAPAASAQTIDDDVDAILDEIDEVLENNAEEFVKGFVQKGGE